MVTGRTVEERRLARAKVTADRRAASFQRRINAAATPRRRLGEVCQYLRAVADDRPNEIDEITAEVLAIANRRNKP